MPLFRLLKDTVVNGGVWKSGYIVDVDEHTARWLENRMFGEAINEDLRDSIDYVHPDRGEEPVQDVLVFVPVYRLEPETVQAVLALEWDGSITHVFQKDNPHPEMRDALKRKVMNHLHQYQRGREMFLNGRYDAMLIVESDIIPPANALQRLAYAGTDVAYGVYRFRGTADIINIWERYPDNNGMRARNVGESLSVRPRLFVRAVQQGVYPCSGAGFGCVLVRRKVLEKVEFRMEYPKNGAYCDTWFTEDVWRAGFSMAADMRVICGHKDTDGTILYPKYPQIIRNMVERAVLEPPEERVHRA